ncbi:MAG: hypothetical protein FWH37_01310 [Candidatus Bathyarchaeota archaeon]|nr:hypothetical protein [Candidatus Termiticorpusculum sp.]
MVNNNIKNITTTALVLVLVASCFTIMASTANAANTNANNKNGVTFTPHVNMETITWNMHAHEKTNQDQAFTATRAHDPTDAHHIQLDGNEAYFYGYYTGSYSDYVYFKEDDATEKTFKFNMNFAIFPENSEILAPQRWHSLRSVGFLVNCIINNDGSFSGFYFSLEPQKGYNNGGDSQIVVRFIDNMDFNDLYEDSHLITGTKTTILTKIELDNLMQTDDYEIKSSNQAFSVTKNTEEIFSFDLADENSQIPDDYTGGNDFGFYAGYIGQEDGHACRELSFAEFGNIELWTKSLVPDISEVSWNNGNGNGNGNGINQLTVNGITLKNNKNYVEPKNFETTVTKTVLAKNDPTAIYTVIDKPVSNTNGGQYEKVYDIKIGLFENGAWKVYSGLLSTDNPGGNEAIQPIIG